MSRGEWRRWGRGGVRREGVRKGTEGERGEWRRWGRGGS